MEGKGMSIQAFAIMAKIAEVDDFVRACGQQQSRVYEVHPEVCFMALAGGRPMQHNKLRAAGRDERRALLSKEFPWEEIEPVRAAFTVGMVGHDDLHDALACLWSARRISRGAAQRVPQEIEIDPAGIDTAIWY
jgi:predicted RNase H-like nuclease